MTRTLELSGRLSPVDEVLLHFQAPGYVSHVYVKQGDRVQAGDLLAELEADELVNQIAQAEIALEAAQSRLSMAEQSLQHEIDLAELNLEVAQAKLAQAEAAHAAAVAQADLALELAKEQLARTSALSPTYASDVTRASVSIKRTDDMVKRARIEYTKALDRPWELAEVRDALAYGLQVAQWDLETAQAEYEEATAAEAAYRHDLNIQRIAVKLAEDEQEQLKEGVDPLLALEVQRAQHLLRGLQAGIDPTLASSVRQAQLTVDQLKGQLTDAQIITPSDGNVISISIAPGRLTEPYQPVIVVADAATVEVVANPTDAQMEELTEGQQANVILSADPDHTWPGMIRCLPYPYGTCSSANDPLESSNVVHISLERGLSNTKVGTLARVSIVLEEKTDVLWLPSAAIRIFQGNEFVIVQEGQRQTRVDVKVGIEGQGRVEIREGLEENQQVLAP